MTLSRDERLLESKFEVLRDLEAKVKEMMESHERKRQLWFPEDLLGPEPGEDPDRHRKALRDQAAGIPDAVRAALALNLITEEGLPHFHRLLAVHFGDETFWRRWMNLWTAEEDRHGAVLRDYCRDAKVLHSPTFDRIQFVPAKRVPPIVGSRSLPCVRLHHASGASDPDVAHEHRHPVRAVRAPHRLHPARIGGDEARHYAFYR